MNHKVFIVLRALLEGHRIEIDGKLFLMSDEYDVCQVAWNQHGEEVYMKMNFGAFSLAEFLNWCDTVSEYDLNVIVANLGLSSLKEKA